MFQTIFVQKIETHILCSVTSPPPPPNRDVYEIMWKNVVEQDTPQMTTWHMQIACWMPKATNKHTGYIILIVFHCSDDDMNEHQCYIIHTLPSWFFLKFHLATLDHKPLSCRLGHISVPKQFLCLL